MPYAVKKGKKPNEFLIVNQKTGVVVGRSNSLDKANRSIGYRLGAEADKNKVKKRG